MMTAAPIRRVHEEGNLTDGATDDSGGSESPDFKRVEGLASDADWRGILALFGNDWFVAKAHLAYDTYVPDQQPWQYDDRLQIMRKLIGFRSTVVDDHLHRAMRSIAGVIAARKDLDQPVEPILTKSGEQVGYSLKVPDPNGFTITAFAPGSTAETSDYDITFSVSGKPAFEVDLVQSFNAAFRDEWGGLESGQVFDTNVYTSGFMPETGKSGDQTVVTYKDKFQDKESHRNFKADKHQAQMALSILPIRQYFMGKHEGRDEQGWTDFADSSTITLAAFLEGRGAPTEVIAAGVDDMAQIFGLAAAFDLETEDWKSTLKEEQRRKHPEMSGPHLEAMANNKLYELQLGRVRTLIVEREQLLREIDGLMSTGGSQPDLDTARQKLAQNITSFQFEQGKALVYANEAYFSAGPAIHVVLGMQGGGAVQLGRQQQMQSLLMNIGYKLAHAEHQEHDGGRGRALVGTAKYGQRIRDLVISGQTTETPDGPKTHTKYKEGVDPGLHELVKDDLALLDNEQRLISDYKKNKQLKTPAAKEAKAEADLGDDMTPEKLERSYLHIATSVFGPYYLSKWESNKQRTDNDRSFW